MSAHTKEPWIRDTASGLNCDVRAESGRKVALCWGLSTTKAAMANSPAYRAECDANASRIVACVNACAGMDDPVAEIGQLRAKLAELERQAATVRLSVDTLRAERRADELLERLEDISRQAKILRDAEQANSRVILDSSAPEPATVAVDAGALAELRAKLAERDAGFVLLGDRGLEGAARRLLASGGE